MTATRDTSDVTLAIDLGGTNLRLALISRDGSIIARLRRPTCVTGGLSAFVDGLGSAIEELRTEALCRHRTILAIGAGVPGLVNGAGLLHKAVNLPFLDGLNINDLLLTTAGLPAVTANDANAAAVGELRFGAGRPFSSFLLFTLGTGVGSGLILNGALWTGHDGIASEFGHATVEPAGVPCPCGNRGCLEQYASASALLTEARQQLDAGTTSILAETDREMLTAESVGQAAAQGDPLALQLLARAGRYLGQAAATAVNLLNLEAFILTGGMAVSFPYIAPAMEAELKARAFPAATKRVRVLPGTLGDDAGLLGMAALAWDKGV